MEKELQDLVADVSSAAKGLVDSATRDVRRDVDEGLSRLRDVEREVRALCSRWDSLLTSSRAGSGRDLHSGESPGTSRTCTVLQKFIELVRAIEEPKPSW